jgi:hypothetical protein
MNECMNLFLMQRYDDSQPIPNNHLNSSPTCCDTPINLRQNRVMDPFYVAN